MWCIGKFFPWVMQFIPWDEMHPSGCKTQFFLPVARNSPISRSRNLREINIICSITQFHGFFFCIRNFTNFFAKSNSNRIAKLNFTNFSVKTTSKKVAWINFTSFPWKIKRKLQDANQFHEFSIKNNFKSKWNVCRILLFERMVWIWAFY